MAEKGGFGLYVDRPYFMGFLFVRVYFAPLFCPKNPIKTALAFHRQVMPGHKLSLCKNIKKIIH